MAGGGYSRGVDEPDWSGDDDRWGFFFSSFCFSCLPFDYASSFIAFPTYFLFCLPLSSSLSALLIHLPASFHRLSLSLPCHPLLRRSHLHRACLIFPLSSRLLPLPPAARTRHSYFSRLFTEFFATCLLAKARCALVSSVGALGHISQPRRCLACQCTEILPPAARLGLRLRYLDRGSLRPFRCSARSIRCRSTRKTTCTL
jgi:hypothetical protein